MMLFALIVLLCQALAIQANLLHADKPGDDIEALCARKSIDLTNFKQLKALKKQAHDSSCTDTTKEALDVLVHLIGLGKKDLCSVESIDDLRGFYTKYLDTSVERNRDKLPKSLRRFVIAYGLQMSNLCKKNMIEVLSQRGHQLLTNDDFEQVEELTSEDGPVAQMTGSLLSRSDDLLTPADLAPFFRSLHQGGIKSDKLFLQTTTGPYVRELQSLCARRFKPIYEPLMMPISRLVNMGFNYKDETLKRELAGNSGVAREVGQWSKIVFLCETLSMIRIVEDHADKEAAEGTDLGLVRLFTMDEAAAMGVADEIDSSDGEKNVETIVYLPETKVVLDDEIYDKKNKQLVAAVKSFKTSKTEEEILKKKLVRRGLSMIGQEVGQGHFKFLMSTGYKSVLQHFKGGKVATPSEELVRMLNEMEATKGGSGSPPDGPVSEENKKTIGQKIKGVFKAIGITLLFVFLFFCLLCVIFAMG